MKRKLFKAQSTMEYAVLVAVIVAALLAMQIYMKRAAEGKMRQSADQIGEQFDSFNSEIVEETRVSGTSVQVSGNGQVTSEADEVITRNANETIF